MGEVSYIGFKVQDGTVKPDYISGSHCSRVGQVDVGTAKLADGTLGAGAKLTLYRKPVALTLTAILIGDSLYGTCRLAGDGGAVCDYRLRGEVLAYDCPPTEGWNEIAWRKEVKRLKAERDAKKTRP